jgi:hypothetical protein
VAIWQWQSGNGTGWRFGARSRSPSAPAGISVGPLITVDRGDTTFAARSGFRFKVALVTSAGGNFGRPLITVDRGDTSEVSGGVSLAISKDLGGVQVAVFEVSGVGLFGVACIFCARAREGFSIAAPVPWSRDRRRHHGLRIGRAIATSRCGNQLNSAHVLDTKCFYSSCATLPFRAILPSATAHGTFHVSATSSTERT